MAARFIHSAATVAIRSARRPGRERGWLNPATATPGGTLLPHDFLVEQNTVNLELPQASADEKNALESFYWGIAVGMVNSFTVEMPGGELVPARFGIDGIKINWLPGRVYGISMQLLHDAGWVVDDGLYHLLDESGNFLTDESGNRLTWSAPSGDAPGYTFPSLSGTPDTLVLDMDSISFPRPSGIEETWRLYQSVRRTADGGWSIVNHSLIRRVVYSLKWSAMPAAGLAVLQDFIADILRGSLHQATWYDWDGYGRVVRLSRQSLQFRQVSADRYQVGLQLEGDV